MFQTLDTDRKVIEGKYHNPEEEFNSFNRMAYHGYAYDEATGLDDAQIDEGLARLAKETAGQPHSVSKARMFEYVLDNTRIDVNAHDYFIGMYTWGRPLSKYTVFKWSDEAYNSFPEEKRLLAEYDEAGAVYGWLDFDHTVPDWDIMMELGFPGLLKRMESFYEDIKASGTLTDKQEAFFRGMETEYKAVIRFIDRLYQYALTKDFAKAPKIAECLKALRDGAPTNTYEALQLIYIYFMISRCAPWGMVWTQHYIRSL